MKLTISLIFTFLVYTSALFAQSLPFNGEWKYILDDNQDYSTPSFNDANWKTISADRLRWDKEELDGKGKFIWTRKKIVIPSSLKKELSKTGALALYMGRIQQDDQTYLNGKLIGQIGTSDLERIYILNEKDINWDKENTVAIRVRHWGERCTIGQKPTIKSAIPEKIFINSTEAAGVSTTEQVNNKKAVYIYNVQNRSAKAVSGIIVADLYDINQQKLKSFTKTVSLKPGKNSIEFPFSSSSPFLKIVYSISVPAYSYKNSWNVLYGHTNVDYKAVQPVIPYHASSFDPADLKQQSIKGWLGEKMEANEEQRLKKVDEAGLLAGYINRPGNHSWIGEHVGKFLEAACNAYVYSKDSALKIQIDRTAQQLIASQLSDGYLGTYEPKGHWTSWDVWSHKYNLVGLLSYYEISGYQPALTAATKIGNLLYTKFGDKPGQRDIIKAGAHVGMAATSIIDPMTDLYRFSGNKNYLDFCYTVVKAFNNPSGPRILSTLDSIGRVDKTANAKAYEMMSNLVGLVKMYRVTGDKKLLDPVITAWKDICSKRLYITGTASSFEHFQDDHLLPASDKDNMGEGCVTTTWLQLNFQLFSVTGQMGYFDEIERSVYNHLIGAENPQTGCVSYYTPLMGVKPYRCVITCCMSSVPRGIAMIPLFANGQIGDKPSILFYQPGIYKTTLPNKTSVQFTTTTSFPQEGSVSIEVDPASKTAFELMLRKPYWAENFKITINGEAQSATGTDLIAINRTWSKGDEIKVDFTMPVKLLDGGISYPGSIAFQRGPQVLVMDNKLNSLEAKDISIPTTSLQLEEAKDALPGSWIGGQAYRVNADSNGKSTSVILVPYADASQTGGDVSTWIKKK